MKSIESLRCFIATVQQGSFSSAAEQLNMSVSSISRHVQILEKEFNAPLLIRHTRRLALTPIGTQVFQKGLEICHQIDDLMDDVASDNQRIIGHIKISAPLWYGTNYLAPLLPEFHRQYPDITVYLNYGDEDHDPYGAEFDLYIRPSTKTDSSLISRPLQSVDYWLCASPEYLTHHPVTANLNDLKHHQWLVQSFRHIINCLYFFDPSTQETTRLDLSHAWLSTNSSPALLAAALHHGGITALPHHMIDEHIQKNQLIRLFETSIISPFQIKNQMAIIYTKDKIKDQKTQTLIHYLLTYLGNK